MQTTIETLGLLFVVYGILEFYYPDKFESFHENAVHHSYFRMMSLVQFGAAYWFFTAIGIVRWEIVAWLWGLFFAALGVWQAVLPESMVDFLDRYYFHKDDITKRRLTFADAGVGVIGGLLLIAAGY